MIQSFQKFSQSRPAKIFLALIALSFAAFFGGNSWFRSRHPHEIIAEVGSITIGHQQFAEKLRQRLQYFTSQTNASREELLKAGFPHLVLTQLIQEHLLNLEASHLELTVSDEAVRSYIHSLKMFQNAKGEFDRGFFAQGLRHSGLSEDAFIATLRQELIRQQLAEAVTAGAFIPEELVNRLFDAYYQYRQASMLLIKPQDIPPPSLPSDKDLEAFYTANEKDFALPELRSFTALLIDPLTFAKDIPVSDQEAQALFEAKGKEFVSKSFEDVKPALIEEIQKDKAQERAHTLSQEIDDKIASGSTLEEVISSTTGTSLTTIELIDAQGRNPFQKALPQLPSDKELLRDLLQTGFSVEENMDSPFSQTRAGTYYMVRVNKITPPTLPAFRDNRERAQQVWIQKEQVKMAKQKAEDYVKAFSAGDRKAELMTLLPSLSLSDSSSPVDENVKNLVFSLPPNNVGMAITPQGFAVVVLNQIIPPEEKVRETHLAAFKANLTASYKEDVLMAYINALRIRYPVTIHGDALAALLAPQE